MKISEVVNWLRKSQQSAILASSTIDTTNQAVYGFIELVDGTGVSGWSQSQPQSEGAVNVIFAFDQELIEVNGANLIREDVKVITGNEIAGFKLPFSDQNTREKVLYALGRCVGSDFDEDYNRDIELSVYAWVNNTDHKISIFKIEGTDSTKKALSQWLEVLDADIEEFTCILHREGHGYSLLPKPILNDATAKVIAFYLPQFHPTEQNDIWWGKGFTEWTSVSTSRPYFQDHISPNLPADFGFYDIRIKETRAAQAELAKLYGIYGFCYYFYWFGGKRLLNKPLDLLLEDSEPNIPYCLCWANESWSRRWDGSEIEVLQSQLHDPIEDLEILEDLGPFFRDKKYIRIDGKPLFLIYRINLMNDPLNFTQEIRKRAVAAGFPGIHICAVLSFGITDGRLYGADSSVEFPPHGVPADEMEKDLLPGASDFEGKIYDYKSILKYQGTAKREGYYFPGVMPRWDNTPRKRASGNVFHRSSPSAFEAWVRLASRRTLTSNPETPLLFVNSWNEWGEGAHLEPDMRYGRQYLEALRRGITLDEDSDESDHQNGYLSSLKYENKFLLKRLAEVDNLKSGVQLRAGSPPGLANVSHEKCVGGHLDLVNGRKFSEILSLKAGRDILISGWIVGSKTETGALYILFEGIVNRTRFFAPIIDRCSREDVANYLDSPNRAGDAGYLTNLSTNRLEPDTYKIRMIDITVTTAYHSDVNHTLEVW